VEESREVEDADGGIKRGRRCRSKRGRGITWQ